MRNENSLGSVDSGIEEYKGKEGEGKGKRNGKRGQ